MFCCATAAEMPNTSTPAATTSRFIRLPPCLPGQESSDRNGSVDTIVQTPAFEEYSETLEWCHALLRRSASRIAIHTLSGVAGISMWSMPYSRHRPSTIALTTAGQDPIAPASPAPLTPSGLVTQGTLWVSNVIGGPSAARGNA